MRVINEEELALLKELVRMEIELIHKGFECSNEYGLALLSNAIASFKDNYLRAKYGEIIPSMCSEYRIFIVEILKQISTEYKEIVLSELLMPKVYEIRDKT